MSRVNGPYPHASRWRVIVIGVDGKRVAHSFASFDEAKANMARLRPPMARPQPLKALWPPTAEGVYFVQVGKLVKIGRSRNISARLNDLRTYCPVPPKLVAYELGPCEAREKELHQRFERYRKRLEWFVLEGELRQEIAAINRRIGG